MFYKNKKEPSKKELIDRAFEPRKNIIDIMFLFPPTSMGVDYAHRYGKKDLGDLKGDLIPLGIASLASYLRKYGFGIAAMVEMLCGILTGMPFGRAIPAMFTTPMDKKRHLGQFYLVMRPDVCQPQTDFEKSIQQMTDEVRNEPAQLGKKFR